MVEIAQKPDPKDKLCNQQWIGLREHLQYNSIQIPYFMGKSMVSSFDFPLPSGKRLHNYGKSHFLMAKSSINGHFQ